MVTLVMMINRITLVYRDGNMMMMNRITLVYRDGDTGDDDE